MKLSYLLVIHFFCFSLPSFAITNNETDRLALLQFKSKITEDPLSILSSWNSSLHFCKWVGIQCGPKLQRVTVLDLNSLELSGTISPYIGNLSFLTVLDLQNNSFSQQIPPQIGHLRRLEYFFLEENNFEGEIHGTVISNLSNLITISLAYNNLEGEIPSEFGSLLKLRNIFLRRNNLVGTLPPSFCNLSLLQNLFVDENQLGGNLPYDLGKLKNLKQLNFGQNQFSGSIPSSFSNLSSIELIFAGFNKLKGNLPSEIGISTLPNLNYLSFSFNELSGTIPSSISNATDLQYVQLQQNSFSGAVPSCEKLHKLVNLDVGFNRLGGNGNDNDLKFLSSLSNSSNLVDLRIHSNKFSGELPQEIGNLSKKLVTFSVQYNQIVGEIPSEIFNLENLQSFLATRNRFSGTIPFTIGKLQNLRKLFLDLNYFVGSIPNSIGNLTNLLELDLSENNLQGTIPSTLGDCKRSTVIDLSVNNLSNSIPLKLFQISSLSIGLWLSGNRLSGSLPIEVGNLKNLQALYLDNNLLSGNIPTSLGSCTSLQFLSLSTNYFQGSVPSSLSSLGGIEELNVSHNKLSGKIPEFLGTFNLTHLDLSYNDFEGEVPTEGVFKNASATSIAGNEKLCGGRHDFGLSPCNSKKPNKRITHKLKIIISVISVVMGLVLLLSCLFLWYSRKEKEGYASISLGNPILNLSYQSLFNATNGFSSSNLIGIGGFGSVYKGILDPKGTIIAVKVLNLGNRAASKSFIAECAAIRNMRHRNLVKVLTACSSADHHGSEFKALVYEFMSNGSLDDWLHPVLGRDKIQQSLNIVQRLNIAIDVACALEYLHVNCGAPIVHCDLKPNNILLDEDMIAHVSDFGLVKFLSNDMVDSTNQFSSFGLRGTVGYCPPEYGLGHQVSTSGDVFSFGILLLEMFSGKRPTDDMFKGSLNLHNLVKEALPERVTQVTDPKLLEMHIIADATSDNDHSTLETNNILTESLISIFEIGISCSVEFPLDRMYIGDVVLQLSSIKKNICTLHYSNDDRGSH